MPPVRRAVPLSRGGRETCATMEQFFGGRKITLYTSGTAALTQAITECARQRPVNMPEVILPAYGCPDLVAACLSAEVFPRLVDISASDWSYDLTALKDSLSGTTVAVVAVNLLGLGDDAAALKQMCQEKGIPLIQDSAQCLPREARDWPGDYVILSFGRGKPLNLLHGGALVLPPGRMLPAAPAPIRYTRRDRLLASRAAAIAFNVLTQRSVYGLISSLPGTGLGDVRFAPLARIERLPDVAWPRIASAFEAYLKKPSYRRALWDGAMDKWEELGIQALKGPDSVVPLEPLRLALLAPDRRARDVLVNQFNAAGLGASHFYGTDLPHVAGIPPTVRRQGPFPHAIRLADRLFTLPTHEQVTESDYSTVQY